MASQIPGEVAEARSLEAELSRTEEVPIEGAPPQIETTEIPVPFDSPLHPEVPPLPPETKLEASEEDNPDFPDEATIPNGRICGISGRRRCRSTIAIGGSGGRDSSRARFLGGRERTRSRAGTLDGGFRTCAAGRTLPFRSRQWTPPEKGEPAGRSRSPRSPKRLPHRRMKKVRMRRTRNPSQCPRRNPPWRIRRFRYPSRARRDVPPDAAESSNERESNRILDAKGDPGEPFSLITPEDIPAASSRKQRVRGTSQTKAKGLPTVEIPRTPEHLLADLPLFGTWGGGGLRIRRPHPSRRKDRKKRTDGQSVRTARFGLHSRSKTVENCRMATTHPPF